MNEYNKFIYVIETCCRNIDDVKDVLDWVERDGLHQVYEKVHYMYDEKDCIKLFR